MSRPIEQALSNLIPRHPGALPPELIELASSLLAQSRNKCSNLKAEEEVARTYACANVACERLKTTLNLPPIEPRPPIPPRVYKNLYAYFDRTLTSSSARQRALRNNLKARATSSKPLPQRLTPGKEKSFESFQKNRSAKKGLRFSSTAGKEARVSRWVVPVIRFLCREMATPRAVPHVLAGVETVMDLAAAGDGIGEKKVQGKAPALIAAVWFFVVVQMRGVVNQGKENLQRKRLALEVLGKARDDALTARKVGEEDGAWAGFEVVEEKDVLLWRREIVDRGWKQMDWFENIVQGCGVDGDDVVDESAGSEADEPLSPKTGNQEKTTRRGCTMLLDKYDYMSSAKQREYEEWRAAMLRKIDDLIKEGIQDKTMDD